MTQMKPPPENPGRFSLVIFIIGPITYSPSPDAARTFLCVMGAGCATAFMAEPQLLGWPAVALILAMYWSIMMICRFTFSSFASRFVRARDLTESVDTVRLLLNDYEQQSSDWLWKTNAAGQFTCVSENAAASAGIRRDALIGVRASDLIDDRSERTHSIEAMQHGEAYRNVVLPIRIEGEKRWWSMSGRPEFDDSGALLRTRGFVSDVTAAKETEARISYLAHYDTLSDLPNRTMFNETLSGAMALRTDDVVALLYIDLDQFKMINDTPGHAVGDEVLKAAAKRIETTIGLQGTVGRLGGDEFAIFLRDAADRDAVDQLAARLLSALSAPLEVDGQQIVAGASIGLAFAPDDAATEEQLLKCADIALYHSKDRGRGCVSRFSAERHEDLLARRSLKADLRLAIGRGELELYYQPLITVATGETSAYEALARWNHPTRGLVMPDIFIPVAEERG